MGLSVTAVKLDAKLDWSGSATISLLCVVSCILDFILKELISFSHGCLHISISHITFTLRQSCPRAWGKGMQAMESMGTGVGQQDTCGNF